MSWGSPDHQVQQNKLQGQGLAEGRRHGVQGIGSPTLRPALLQCQVHGWLPHGEGQGQGQGKGHGQVRWLVATASAARTTRTTTRRTARRTARSRTDNLVLGSCVATKTNIPTPSPNIMFGPSRSPKPNTSLGGAKKDLCGGGRRRLRWCRISAISGSLRGVSCGSFHKISETPRQTTATQNWTSVPTFWQATARARARAWSGHWHTAVAELLRF